MQATHAPGQVMAFLGPAEDEAGNAQILAAAGRLAAQAGTGSSSLWGVAVSPE